MQDQRVGFLFLPLIIGRRVRFSESNEQRTINHIDELVLRLEKEILNEAEFLFAISISDVLFACCLIIEVLSLSLDRGSMREYEFIVTNINKMQPCFNGTEPPIYRVAQK